MRFKKLILIDFKRFPLAELELFEKDLHASLFQITGPNGAGKSSLFNELTPLPTDKNFFGKKGYKEIHIEHNNIEYVLICDFTGSSKFSFKMDGEELNTAGIVTTQRDLALQHFSITPSIHDILTGSESFCDMSLPARKKLFSTITHMNIDAVLAGYNELKEEQKTVTLLHKSHLSNFKSEESKLMDSVLLEERKQELVLLKEKIDQLLTMRSDIQRYRDTQTSDNIYPSLKKTSETIREFISKNYLSLTAYPRNDINRIRENKQSELYIVNYKLDNYYKSLEIKARELSLLSESNSIDKVQLENNLQYLSELIERRVKSISLIDDISTVTDATFTAVYKMESTLPDIVSNMLPNAGMEGERVYTRERYDDLITTKNSYIDELHRISAEELAVRQSINKVNDATGNIECPSCEHTWPLKDALKASTHKEEELTKLIEDQRLVRGKLASLERTIDEVREYFQQYKQLSILRKDTLDTLPFFWKYVDDNEYIFLEPTKLTQILNSLNHELVFVGEIKEAERERVKVESKLRDIKVTENVSTDTIRAEVEELSNTVKDLQSDKIDLTREIKEIAQLTLAYTKLEEMETGLTKTRQSVRDHHLDHLTVSIVSIIDDKIREYRIGAVAIENDLHQINTIEYTLKKYQKDIDETQEKLKVLDAILTELCPKSGLIAKSVSSFLNTIIYNVNSTINKIWNYKMILRPIDIDSDTLNYRFKVEVEDKVTIDDISKVSKGMKEAINLSFKLVMYKLLKFDNYPLFLDELGSNLDTNHSQRLLDLTNSLSTSGRFSQIFLITHKENYGFLRGLETIELG